jgi:hypothetical protein
MSTKSERSIDSRQSLAILDRYDEAAGYIYQRVQQAPKRHGRYRDKLLDAVLAVPGLLYAAAKSGQISRLYVADAALAELRWMLRFAAHSDRRIISHHQQTHAEVLLAEVGKMLGEWIKNKAIR